MMQKIKTIKLSLPFNMVSVNCYLIETGTGHILIDTGYSNKRKELIKELSAAGCRTGSLKLIILTHGDFDHAGNAAYLSKEFGAKTAMHLADTGMVEFGDMFWNRKTQSNVIRHIAPLVFRKSKRFTPDLYVDEGYDLAEYGFKARVIHTPGHSMGSIGVLTSGNSLFCGDLLKNRGTPCVGDIIDDPAAADSSLEKLKSLAIDTVYPGHGEPFAWEEFVNGAGK
jgi:glyoxylase-like metal-dependent hydrolase (beta-lactamase superfamily II)